jgi:ABC-type lipoprotein export system ATPase subunit
MLARGLASDPDLFLVDEPTAQLDRHTASQVNNVLGELAGTGAIVVIATHDHETKARCDEVIDLDVH